MPVGPARPQHRGPAAPHHRRRAEAPARAALVRRRAHLPRPGLRRDQPGAARGPHPGRRDRGHALRLDRRQSRAPHRPQRLDRAEADRRQESRGPPGARASRPPGLPAAAHRLRPLPARRPASRRGGRGAPARSGRVPEGAEGRRNPPRDFAGRGTSAKPWWRGSAASDDKDPSAAASRAVPLPGKIRGGIR